MRGEFDMVQDINQKIVFATTVQEIGQEARDFSEIKMAILFGDEAPDALRSSCYIIKVKPVQTQITAQMLLQIDDECYPITAVGNEVQTNLNNLGHIAISFTGAVNAELPGTLYVADRPYPDIQVGSKIYIKQVN
ncbi:PTS glucitol/sorbitol transporter subunit IIA [Loigolactobacillus binensis]|uniref:PTS glucitol/sorbitol transporter subunit IIA n=1 Tax=Loigolactobacillus binensis TaxID=2559922 RepID=A0ABW3EDY2_9LACO|nr:PTS glucitol/sorbitol transporter subunit IIA [Loigolactobacillus binensis]